MQLSIFVKRLLMKHLLTFSLLFLTFISNAQDDVYKKYKMADLFLNEGKTEQAYNIYKELEPQLTKTDTLYNYVLWYYTMAVTALESENRMAEKWQPALNYGLEAIALIEKGKPLFNENFTERYYWMQKNVIVSYFGLSRPDDAKKHKNVLYAAYREGKLPEGIEGYFNFSFFKWNDKNIWGYEWYPELPEDRFNNSFTKVVYYVYSTNTDGSDKDQLYRFHVLMFHQDAKDAAFDYILERQIEKDNVTESGSYYMYTYKKDIDYVKLKKDIIEILEKNIQPDTRRTTSH